MSKFPEPYFPYVSGMKFLILQGIYTFVNGET